MQWEAEEAEKGEKKKRMKRSKRTFFQEPRKDQNERRKWT
jgi:hypothetical protein